MELLHEYYNGNCHIKLFDNGTKEIEFEGKANPVFPTSMDVKITNWCDLNCPFCHEMSTIKGKHSDTVNLLKVLTQLPAGTELALGGGNPLEHPGLLFILNNLKEHGIVVNMTVNYKHLIQYKSEINYLIDNKLIYGLGLSIEDDFNIEDLNVINNKSNIVFHVIAGVNSISILNKIKISPVRKVLILGYKDVGRGIKFHSEETDKLKEEWFNELGKHIRKIHLSFDNLALTQLDIKRFLTQAEWNEFFMGIDGSLTMYLDAVEEKYALSSTSPYKFNWTSDIKDMFNHVKTLSEAN